MAPKHIGETRRPQRGLRMRWMAKGLCGGDDMRCYYGCSTVFWCPAAAAAFISTVMHSGVCFRCRKTLSTLMTVQSIVSKKLAEGTKRNSGYFVSDQKCWSRFCEIYVLRRDLEWFCAPLISRLEVLRYVLATMYPYLPPVHVMKNCPIIAWLKWFKNQWLGTCSRPLISWTTENRKFPKPTPECHPKKKWGKAVYVKREVDACQYALS